MNSTLVTGLTYLIAYLGGLVSGVILSYFLHQKKDGQVKSNDIVLMAVTVVWTITRLISLINTQIIVSPALDALMGGLVGYFYKGSLPIWKKPEQK